METRAAVTGIKVFISWPGHETIKLRISNQALLWINVESKDDGLIMKRIMILDEKKTSSWNHAT